MQVSRRPLASRLSGLVVGGTVLLALTACPGAQRRTTRFERLPSSTTTTPTDETPPPPAVATVTFEERDIAFTLPGGEAVVERAVVGVPNLDGTPVKGPVVVIVPGGSDVSRRGLRRGDGVLSYAEPVAVTAAWQQVFGAAGAWTLAWDKRTCGPNDDPDCLKNPQADVDAEGPVALARDVDAACDAARALPGYDGRLVVLAHGQAGQVALSSTCAESAAAVVLLNPIPRSIDAVLVDALRARHEALLAEARTKSGDERAALEERAAGLKNLAESRAAAFASMTSGRFSPEARVDGATIAFWLGWMTLTGKTTDLARAQKPRLIVVTAEGDSQLSPGDQERARALPAARVLSVPGDHHFLSDGALSEETVKPIVEAIEALLVPAAS